MEARRRRRREAHRRHELAAGRAARALWTIATKAARSSRSSPTAARRRCSRSTVASWDPRERSGQGAQLLGDGAPPDLLGASAEEVRLVLRARRARREIGQLLEYTGVVFEYWHDYRDGKLPRAARRVDRLRPEAGARARSRRRRRHRRPLGLVRRHRGARAGALDLRRADDVEPTNNHAEREIRAFVLWRKRSYGTQSDRGNVFAERLMTVAHTARKQNKTCSPSSPRAAGARARRSSCPTPSLPRRTPAAPRAPSGSSASRGASRRCGYALPA